jgi:hypothetical protein
MCGAVDRQLVFSECRCHTPACVESPHGLQLPRALNLWSFSLREKVARSDG